MSDNNKGGSGFATVALTILFVVFVVTTAINVSKRQFGSATAFGFCALYCLTLVRLAFDDWIHSDNHANQQTPPRG